MWPESNVRNGRSNDGAAGNRKGVTFISSDYVPASYPEDVVNHRHIIIHEELPENMDGPDLQVYVRRVYSPSEFWINLCGLDYSRQLVTLHTDMREFYEKKQDRYLLPDYAVLVGQFCVCLYSNEWHRARIVNTADRELVDVFLIDCGGSVTVSASDLRFMHKKFSHLPIQSFRANLPDIKPRSGAEWPNNVCEFFCQETSGKKFFVKVVNVAREKHSVSLILLDVNRNSVSEKLLSNNMAEADTQGFDARTLRNEESIDASCLKVEKEAGIPDDTSSRFEDNNSIPPEDEGVSSRSEDVPDTCDYWRIVHHVYVIFAERRLLLVKIKGKNYFVLENFLQAFSPLHTHVVLRLLKTFRSRVVVEKMEDDGLIKHLFRHGRGRRIRGLAHLHERGIRPSVHLLPVGEASQLLGFLGEDGIQSIFSRYLDTVEQLLE